MGQHLLGLDIGHSSIKGVRLSKGFRGLQLLDVFEAPVSRNTTQEEDSDGAYLSAAHIDTLNTLVSKGKIHKIDLIAIALPGDLQSTHEITLPFTDRKKIAQIVPFEIESVLPFDFEDVSIDYMLLNKSQHSSRAPKQRPEESSPSRSHLLVSAIHNALLSDILQQLQQIGLDPAWVGGAAHAHFAFARYFLGLNENKIKELLVINIGAKRTTLCHVDEGSLQWMRTIPLGSDDLNETLMTRCKLSWDEVEQQKAYLDLSQSGGQNRDSIQREDLESALSPLISEIEKNLRVMQPRLKQDPSLDDESSEAQNAAQPLLYLSGGGSALKGLSGVLSELLDMDIAHIDPSKRSPGAKIKGIDRLSPEEISQKYATAFGIVLQENDGPLINFRQGEFAFGKETIARRQRVVTYSIFVVLLLGLMGADLYLHFEEKEQHYQNLKLELRQAFTDIFPKVRNIVDEVEQSRSAITELKKKGDFLGVSARSPLKILKDISEKIPDTVKIDVHNLVIDGLTVRIQAQTQSFEAVDKIRGALLSATHFTQVEVSDAKATANQKHVRFRIKMSVQE